MHRNTSSGGGGFPMGPPGETKTGGGTAMGGTAAADNPGGTRTTMGAPARGGVLVPRPVAVFAVLLMVAMAVAIGVLAAPYLRSGTTAAGGTPSPSATGSGTAEHGTFTAAPRACSLLGDALAAELVPNLKTSEVSREECNWLTSDFRLPEAAKYDLLLRMTWYKPGDGEVAKARDHFTGEKDEYLQKGKSSTASPSPAPLDTLSGLGDEAIAYTESTSIDIFGGTAKRIVVIRKSNLVLQVEYKRGGAKDDKDGRLAAGAEKAARAIMAEVAARG
ncbi:hypothetical protein [Spongiactinospora sp. TRM90649]|uniref:hypothetical protein n=1 Tax=Spongiactinospora sp. TRM90649 TaxID=3031114 RepID=UPI0023F98896|nr:hypothetical protein [Spongiactinospora sp. TRM90649]MDF5751035.1 hypothetical protein [Spongiactinospora sp. TRM90649]